MFQLYQSKGDIVAESSSPNWIPMGYAFLPNDPSYVLMSTKTDDCSEADRRTVINNFTVRIIY